MAKVLLGHHNIEKYINGETKSIQVDGSVIIPPGMKDYLQTRGISLIYTKPGEVQVKPRKNDPEVSAEKTRQDDCVSEQRVGILTTRIVSILKNEHQMTDEETIRRICLQVINQINQ